MANFKSVTSTVCGAAGGLNDVLNGIDDFGDDLLKTIKLGPAKKASEVIGETKQKLDNAESFLKGLVPKLPTLKDLGLQDSVDDLKKLVGDATAYADKVTSIAAAFGELDFEKIMLATCDADNLKIDSKGRLVTVAKNVTIRDTLLAAEKFEEKIASSIVTTADDLGIYDVAKKFTEVKGKVANIQGEVTTLAKKYTEVKGKIDTIT